MLKKIKAITLVSLLCATFVPNMAFAQNNEIVNQRFDKSNFTFDKSKIQEIVSYNDINREMKSNVVEINSISSLSENKNNSVDADPFEPNNIPDAARYLAYNETIDANIDNINDIDWYRFEISQYNVDECEGGMLAVILKNIPYGKDYKLNVLKKMPDGNYKIYTTKVLQDSQAIYDDISAGEYLIAIVPNKTISENYSSDKYELYVGDAFISHSTGYMDTNLNFNFGFNKYNPRYLSEAQYFDLSNDSSIPENSFIKEVYVTSDGNDAHWIGLIKTFDGYEASMALDYIHLPKYEIPVKENHSIQAYITKSDGFIWQPRVQINYIYPLLESNYRFYFNR